ncbi:hypothetical protein B9J87_13005 [Vibrio sp. V19_P1S1T109]|nr:hypothetical protein B9J87_13005 [Vibrio sp. V19_P1S1T109]
MTDLNEKKAMLHCLSVYLPLIGIREIKLDISNETPSPSPIHIKKSTGQCVALSHKWQYSYISAFT